MKGEQVWEQHSKTVSTTVRDISKDGIKFEINHTAETSGKLKGHVTGTTTIWMKTDGSSEWEEKNMGMTAEGDFFAGWGKGTGKMTGPGATSWEGEVHVMSQAPKLAWLNEAKIWASGTADQAKGESHAKFFHQK